MGVNNHRIDEILSLLADRHRRRGLCVLRNGGGRAMTLDTLASEIASADDVTADRATVETSLYHVHLPKLADAGVVEFDARSGDVRYRSVPLVEDVLTLLEESS